MEYPLTSFERVYLDFDGPILDCKARHHRVFRDVMLAVGVAPDRIPGADELWSRKRAGATTQELAQWLEPDADLDFVKRQWMEWIEREDYLKLDGLQSGALYTLTTLWDAGRDIRLLTARQNEDNLYEQVTRFGLDALLDSVIVCPPNGSGQPKHAPLKIDMVGFSGSACLVGDSELDMSAARGCGIAGLGVTCGIREESQLISAGALQVRRDLRSYVSRCAA